jgi:hypothetical protein
LPSLINNKTGELPFQLLHLLRSRATECRQYNFCLANQPPLYLIISRLIINPLPPQQIRHLLQLILPHNKPVQLALQLLILPILLHRHLHPANLLQLHRNPILDFRYGPFNLLGDLLIRLDELLLAHLVEVDRTDVLVAGVDDAHAQQLRVDVLVLGGVQAL